MHCLPDRIGITVSRGESADGGETFQLTVLPEPSESSFRFRYSFTTHLLSYHPPHVKRRFFERHSRDPLGE